MNQTFDASELTGGLPLNSARQRLSEARVFVSRASDLGAVILTQLAAAGVGQLRFADGGDVTPATLPGQTVLDQDDLGLLRAVAVRTHLQKLRPECATFLFIGDVTPDHVEFLLQGQSLAVAVDEPPTTRALLAAACARAQVPLVCAEVNPGGGSVWAAPPAGELAPPAAGVVPPPAGEVVSLLSVSTAGVLGSLAAAEVLRLLTDAPRGPQYQALTYDALNGTVSRTDLDRLRDLGTSPAAFTQAKGVVL